MMYKQREQMVNSKHNMEILNIKYHDLKYQINNIGHRIDGSELEELHKVINAYDLYVDTGNEALNVVLSEKRLVCEINKIKLNYIIDGKQLNFMQASDIYSLFGNAIDNAIAATIQIDQIEKKNIKISVIKKVNMVLIIIENHYIGDIIFSDSLPVTTKKDKDFHGFGMKSIRYIVDKYHGFMNVKTIGDRFVLTISFGSIKENNE